MCKAAGQEQAVLGVGSDAGHNGAVHVCLGEIEVVATMNFLCIQHLHRT
jgi:hypothetical protein